MKIVVTGGLGFVGRNFARYMDMLDEEHQVISIDHFSTASPQDHALFSLSHVGCFASDAAKPIYEGADAVVHLAASTTVQESITNPFASFQNNVIRTQALLDHLRIVAPKAHVIAASTGGAIIGAHDGPVHENIAPRPVSPYGATKLAMEGLLSAYSGSFAMPTAALRFSNVYGPLSERKASVVATYCREWLGTGQLRVNGDGTQTRDYIHVRDICQAIWRVIDRRATGPFQLGTGVATSINDLIATLRALDPDRTVHITRAPELPGEVKHNICDINHARQVIGFEPETTLKPGLKDTLSWFRNHR